MAGGKSVSAVATDTPFLTSSHRPKVENALQTLENAIAAAERTISRALTNGSLGLGGIGVGRPGESGGKGSMGAGEAALKSGFGPGEPGGKQLGGPGESGGKQLGGPGESGGKQLGPPAGDDLSALNADAGQVVALFRMVADALRSLEISLAAFEGIVLGDVPADADNTGHPRLRVVDAARSALLAIRDALIGASETSILVLQHPVHGIGPAPGLGSFGRKHLAARGGLSSGFLRLLSPPPRS
jgi:hypothetical protein